MRQTNMLLRLLLIASSLYYSDAKKMHRSRVRQEWKVHCAKGESISGLTAQHVIDDVVATFACESLGHSSGSPAIQEGACRETKEFQVFKDGKLAPGGGESGCKSDEYVAGVRSSVSGKATKFERKLMFKCCKATNAEIDESSCHTVGPRHPFHVKRGEIVNLVNNAKKSGPSCPKYGLNAFLVDQNGFTLKYCLWKIKGAKYPETCSNEPAEKGAHSNSKEKTADKGLLGHARSQEEDSSNAGTHERKQTVRNEGKHSGLSGHQQAAADKGSVSEEAVTPKPKHSSKSRTTTTAHDTSSVPSLTTKAKITQTDKRVPLTADELSEIVNDPDLKPEIEGEEPKKPKKNDAISAEKTAGTNKDHVASDSAQPATTKPRRKPASSEAKSNAHNSKENPAKSAAHSSERPSEHKHSPTSPSKEEHVELSLSDQSAPASILASIDSADEPRIHIHEETIAVPADIEREKSAAHKAVSTSGMLKCKPGSVGNQKWGCFAGEHCSSDAGCEKKCNNWKPGLDFGTVAAAKCVEGNGSEKYCCCTYEGQGQTDCPSANDRGGSTKGGVN